MDEIKIISYFPLTKADEKDMLRKYEEIFRKAFPADAFRFSGSNPDETDLEHPTNQITAGDCRLLRFDNYIVMHKPDKTVDVVVLDQNGAVSVRETLAIKPNIKKWFNIEKVVTGKHHMVGLRTNGKVVAFGENNYGQCNIAGWENIVDIIAGDNSTIGLTHSGEMIVAMNEISVSAGGSLTVGLDCYGHVEWTGNHFQKQYEELGDWYNIVQISAGITHTLGVLSDGTVIAAGRNNKKECDVGDWKHIICVSAGEDFSLGLTDRGKVLAVGKNTDGQCNVEDWRNIVAISGKYAHAVGLLEDGSVTATGDNRSGQCEVRDWQNIQMITTGRRCTAGLNPDGTVSLAGCIGSKFNSEPDSRYLEWQNIVDISAGGEHLVCLKDDGRVVAAGSNQFGQCNVEDWTDVIAVSAGERHTVGLRSDGTLLAVGDNSDRQCQVGEICLLK